MIFLIVENSENEPIASGSSNREETEAKRPKIFSIKSFLDSMSPDTQVLETFMI